VCRQTVFGTVALLRHAACAAAYESVQRYARAGPNCATSTAAISAAAAMRFTRISEVLLSCAGMRGAEALRHPVTAPSSRGDLTVSRNDHAPAGRACPAPFSTPENSPVEGATPSAPCSLRYRALPPLRPVLVRRARSGERVHRVHYGAQLASKVARSPHWVPRRRGRWLHWNCHCRCPTSGLATTDRSYPRRTRSCPSRYRP
jgi:hypothetical protein